MKASITSLEHQLKRDLDVLPQFPCSVPAPADSPYDGEAVQLVSDLTDGQKQQRRFRVTVSNLMELGSADFSCIAGDLTCFSELVINLEKFDLSKLACIKCLDNVTSLKKVIFIGEGRQASLEKKTKIKETEINTLQGLIKNSQGGGKLARDDKKIARYKQGLVKRQEELSKLPEEIKRQEEEGVLSFLRNLSGGVTVEFGESVISQQDLTKVVNRYTQFPSFQHELDASLRRNRQQVSRRNRCCGVALFGVALTLSCSPLTLAAPSLHAVLTLNPSIGVCVLVLALVLVVGLAAIGASKLNRADAYSPARLYGDGGPRLVPHEQGPAQ